MRKILHGYIFRETAQTWLAVTGVLLSILLTDQIARVLDDAAMSKVPEDEIIAVIGFSSIQYLTILIPVGILLAVMLSLARMYRDSEISAMMSCGIGNKFLYRPIMFFSMILVVFSAWLSIEAGPNAQRKIQLITDKAQQKADLAVLEPGRFISFGMENFTLYAEKIGDQGQLLNVFLQRREANKVTVVVSEEATQRNDEMNSSKVLTFKNGTRYEGKPGSREFRVMKFREHGIPFAANESSSSAAPIEAMTVKELLELADLKATAELQWRVSTPLTLLILTLIAVPLSRSNPREGRYNNLVAAILLYIIYINLLGVARVWLEQGITASWVGLWWVHAFFLLFAISMLMSQNRILYRMFSKRIAN
ncbi:MAG: LPS export ABC transporter permease LptF [Pseudomonadota bacterium]|nr:LPS export ABC transporter permease LptF [Pseudomonadota bacterium]